MVANKCSVSDSLYVLLVRGSMDVLVYSQTCAEEVDWDMRDFGWTGQQFD